MTALDEKEIDIISSAVKASLGKALQYVHQDCNRGSKSAEGDCAFWLTVSMLVTDAVVKALEAPAKLDELMKGVG